MAIAYRPMKTTVASGAARGHRGALLTAALVACAALLAGCETTAARPSAAEGSQAGESGVTVFGTIDTGVGAVRSSR